MNLSFFNKTFSRKSNKTINKIALLLLVLLFSAETFAAKPFPTKEVFCARPIIEKDIPVFFERSARLQLKLEFGDGPIKITKLKSMQVGPTLVRVDGFARLRQPGREDLSEKRITGWVERCQGVVIIRGNTWLTDGTLAVPRFSREQLQGRGLTLGKQEAPLHLIAFVDSRCPHCHRLMSYVEQLVKAGKITIEIRQTAFLESAKEALQDTRLAETSLIRAAPGVKTNDTDYFEMLSGFPNDEEIPVTTLGYDKALEFLNRNTKTARNVLGITNVPALLVLDNKKDGLYRLAGYWEMNRLLQPDL
jgi:thiol-disulfide isomerase/thioredoxin